MDEKKKIKELKEAEGYYTPTEDHGNKLNTCMSMAFLLVSFMAFSLSCAWFVLAYSVSFAPPPTPAPTPYPTAVPMATPAVNPATGQLQTVIFDTAQHGISISYPNFNGQIEGGEVCWRTNVCSWIAPPVPTGEMLTISWWNRNDGAVFANTGSLEVEPWQLLIEIEE
jgi:hypothetical protein